MTVFYTIGYGGRHPQRDFVALLQQHHITLVCDVRIEPRKAYRGVYTFNPEKGTGPLVRLLLQASIKYRWFSELGNPERQDPNIRAFRQLMAQQGATLLQPLRACLQVETACLLCAEQDVQRCHRQVIAAYLEADGFSARHL